MAAQVIPEAVCPACNNTGYVPESEDEVTGCTAPGCPYWAEHDAKQGRIVIDITPRPKTEQTTGVLIRYTGDMAHPFTELEKCQHGIVHPGWCEFCGGVAGGSNPERRDAEPDDHPMHRLGLTEDQWFDLCHDAWERSDGTQYIPGR